MLLICIQGVSLSFFPFPLIFSLYVTLLYLNIPTLLVFLPFSHWVCVCVFVCGHVRVHVCVCVRVRLYMCDEVNPPTYSCGVVYIMKQSGLAGGCEG